MELALEFSVFDRDSVGNPYFVVSTSDGPATISVPPDLFERPPTIIDSVIVRTVSPLALVRIRAGANATGAFGTARPDKDTARQARLIDVFLRDVDPGQLKPTITLIEDLR